MRELSNYDNFLLNILNVSDILGGSLPLHHDGEKNLLSSNIWNRQCN